jgi:hypothetical protein
MSECDSEVSKVRGPWPTRGCSEIEKKIKWNSSLDEFRSLLGLAVVEAACRLRLTAKTWIKSRASPCEFCCRRIGTGVVSVRFLRFYPVSIIPRLLLSEGPADEASHPSNKAVRLQISVSKVLEFWQIYKDWSEGISSILHFFFFEKFITGNTYVGLVYYFMA